MTVLSRRNNRVRYQVRYQERKAKEERQAVKSMDAISQSEGKGASDSSDRRYRQPLPPAPLSCKHEYVWRQCVEWECRKCKRVIHL